MEPRQVRCRYELRDDSPPPRKGYWLRTDAGSAYLIVEVQWSNRSPSKYNLRMLAFGRGHEIPADATVYSLRWNSRGKR